MKAKEIKSVTFFLQNTWPFWGRCWQTKVTVLDGNRTQFFQPVATHFT